MTSSLPILDLIHEDNTLQPTCSMDGQDQEILLKIHSVVDGRGTNNEHQNTPITVDSCVTNGDT